MKRRLLARRPSPAMIVAVIALVGSFTGGAFAAGLIGTADIENGAVTKKKVHKNAVTTKKVKNKTLLAKDFKPGQLEEGVQGIQGLQGEKGDKGEPGQDGQDGQDGTNAATNVTTRITTDNIGPGNVNLTAPCDAGEKAVGGGPRFTDDEPEIVAQQAYPSPITDGTTPTGWTVRYEISGIAHVVSVAVVCVSP